MIGSARAGGHCSCRGGSGGDGRDAIEPERELSSLSGGAFGELRSDGDGRRGAGGCGGVLRFFHREAVPVGGCSTVSRRTMKCLI